MICLRISSISSLFLNTLVFNNHLLWNKIIFRFDIWIFKYIAMLDVKNTAVKLIIYLLKPNYFMCNEISQTWALCTSLMVCQLHSTPQLMLVTMVWNDGQTSVAQPWDFHSSWSGPVKSFSQSTNQSFHYLLYVAFCLMSELLYQSGFFS